MFIGGLHSTIFVYVSGNDLLIFVSHRRKKNTRANDLFLFNPSRQRNNSRRESYQIGCHFHQEGKGNIFQGKVRYAQGGKPVSVKIKVRSGENPTAAMSFAFSIAICEYSSRAPPFQRNFSSSVSWITKGALKASYQANTSHLQLAHILTKAGALRFSNQANSSLRFI